MTTCTTYESSLETQIGLVKVSCCTKGVHSIHINENENPALYSSIVIKVFETVGDPKCLTDTLQWLKGYFEGQVTPSPDVCEMVINSKGPFTQLVWRTLKHYPFGNIFTYGDLAEMCGRSKGAARAVGTAMRTNPVPLIVPCHRVVKKGGDLGQYSGGGGSRTKRWLLDHEGKVRAALMREFIQDLNAQKAALEALEAELPALLVENLLEEYRAELEAVRAANDHRSILEAACAALEAYVAARAANQTVLAEARATVEAACVAIEAYIAAHADLVARVVERAARREEHIQQHPRMTDGA